MKKNITKKSNLKIEILILVIYILNCNCYAQSLTAIDELYFVADIDAVVQGNSGDVYSNDSTVIMYDISTGFSTVSNNLGTIAGIGIDGFHNSGDGCGNSIYSLDSTTVIAGTAMRPADVFTAAGVKIFDALSEGIPSGVNIDAISREPNTCDLLISIDITSKIGGVAYKSDDVIRWNSSSGFSLFQSLNLGVNVDALHYLKVNKYLISTDIAIAMTDIDGLDEEVFEINTTSGSQYQLLALDASQINSSWQAVDLNALWAMPTVLPELMFSNGFE